MEYKHHTDIIIYDELPQHMLADDVINTYINNQPTLSSHINPLKIFKEGSVFFVNYHVLVSTPHTYFNEMSIFMSLNQQWVMYIVNL